MLLMAIMLCGGSALGQSQTKAENRTLMYLGAGLNKDFSKKLQAGIDLEGRFCGSKKTQDILLTPSIEYSVIKFLSVGAEYRIGYSHEQSHDGEWSGRLGLAAKAKASPGNLKMEARAKYCNYSEDYEDEGNLQYMRTKLEIGFKIKSIKITPYLSYEWFYNISRGLVDKDRYTFGLKKKINKRNSVGFEYMLEEKFNRGPNKRDINKNIFAFSYQYTIPQAKKSAD